MDTALQERQDILAILGKNGDRIRAFGVKKIGLFGSFVRGHQNADSDVDLLVEFEPDKKTFDNFINLSFFLEDLLKHRVELVTRESLSPYIGPHILAEIEYVALDIVWDVIANKVPTLKIQIEEIIRQESEEEQGQ